MFVYELVLATFSYSGKKISAIRNFVSISMFCLFMFCICITSSYGATINAKSASYSDVASAIATASSGDTVIVPAGSTTWASALTITKGINLIGPGTDNLTIKNGGSEYLIYYEPADYAPNQSFRLSGFTFDANGKRILKLGATGKSSFFVENTKVRIDNNKFTDSSGTGQSAGAIWNSGTLYGVVDSNLFAGFSYPIKNDPSVNMDSWWNNSPQNIFELGSYRYLYYEDNTFTGPIQMITDGQYSARYVFRYNTIISTGVPSGTTIQLFDLHGEQPTGLMAACFGVEQYGNYAISTDNNYMKLQYQRSGQSRIFNNVIATTAGAWGVDAYTGTTPSPCPAAYADRKVIHNSYWWNNRKNYKGISVQYQASADLTCNGLTGIPTFGRDVFSDSSTPGIACGILASLPATCSPGQGYWATNQSCTDLTGMVGANPATPISGTLYKCTSTNNWMADYTPYTYPHPLRSVGTMLSPMNLRFVN